MEYFFTFTVINGSSVHYFTLYVMDKNQQIKEGTRLKYVGKGFEDFQPDQPYMIFLGYDSNGWCDAWVDYLGKKTCVPVDEVELAE